MRFVGPLALAVVAALPGSVIRGDAQSAGGTTIEVIVTRADGQPVTDLQADDLMVRLDNRPQSVTDIRITRRDETPALRAGLPPPYGTNTGVAGRTTAILVDVARLTPERTGAMASGLQSLVSALTQRDRLALIPLSTDDRPVDFTTTHARVLEAAGALTLRPGTPSAPRTRRQDEAAVEATLGALTRAAALLGSEPGVKTLVVITEPFTITSDLRKAIQTLGEAVARHRIALYIATPGHDTVPATDGVHALAAGTGGLVVSGAWSVIAIEEAARVEVTLAPDSRLDEDDLVRALILTSRSDLRVRGIPFAYIPAATTEGLEPLSDMLRQSRTFTDLPLRLAAYPVLHSDRASIRLLIVGETIDDERPLMWSEFALVAPDGRVAVQWSEDRDAVAERPLISGVLAQEGTFRLRWAASELSGRRGTVDVEVDARFTAAGPFRLSALMLGRLAGDTFQPRLQSAPGATHVEWYAEIYGDLPEGAELTTRLDVLTDAAATPLATEPGRVLTSPDVSRHAMTGGVDVSALDAGDYLLRATLVVNGTDAGSIIRTFRKAR